MDVRANGRYIVMNSIEVGPGAIVSCVDETETIITVIGYCMSRVKFQDHYPYEAEDEQ